jgi:hypothetical protein
VVLYAHRRPAAAARPPLRRYFVTHFPPIALL